MPHDFVEHLRFFADLGVMGVSRDPGWRRRARGASGASNEGPGTSKEDAGTSKEVPSIHGGASIHAEGGSHLEGTPSGVPEGAGSPLEEGNSLEVPPGLSAAEQLAGIKADIGPDCARCKLCTLGRRQIVFGVGNPKARLMFVGEAPGEDEDKQGEPFVGRAGQLLTKIIEAIGLTRDQVYIANVIKCRPPGNRNPEPDEVASCEPFLFRQIDAIRPKVIVPLGKFAAQSLLKTTDPITRLRGREYSYRGATLIPTFHPAFLLRNPSAKREVWEDMKKVRALLQDEE
jgi:uracil-DNA glycosylase family 4